MSDAPTRPSVLPPELAELEAAMRAEPPAPPAALLDRIQATRDGVVVTFSGPEPFIPEERPWYRRWPTAVAAAAVVMVGVVGAWMMASSRATPTTAAVAAGPAIPEAKAPTGDALRRLLVPWPSPAYAQLPSDIDRRYPHRATLAPQALGRLRVEQRVYSRVVRDASGREVSHTRMRWTLDTLQFDGAVRLWVLSTASEPDSGGGAIGIDTMIFGARAFELVQRRVHQVGYERYFLFDLAYRRLVVADSASTLHYPSTDPFEQRQRLWNAIPSTGVRQLSGRHTLAVSEAHLAVLLRTVPLWVEWESTAAIPSPFDYIAPRYDAGVMGLRVTGIDTITTTKGAVPCYRVTLDYGQEPDIWWISVTTGEFVRGVRTLSDSSLTEVTTVDSIIAAPKRSAHP